MSDQTPSTEDFMAAHIQSLEAKRDRLRAELAELTGKCTCVWCGKEYHLGPTQEECIAAMKEHMEECEKHPIHALRAELDTAIRAANARRAALSEEVETLQAGFSECQIERGRLREANTTLEKAWLAAGDECANLRAEVVDLQNQLRDHTVEDNLRAINAKLVETLEAAEFFVNNSNEPGWSQCSDHIAAVLAKYRDKCRRCNGGQTIGDEICPECGGTGKP